MRRLTFLGLLAVFSLVVALPAAADPIAYDKYDNGVGKPVGGYGWLRFEWGEDGWSNIVSFPINSARSVAVEDVWISGDRFEIYDFGVLVGVTSVPVLGLIGNDDLNVIPALPGWSGGGFFASVGLHSVQLHAIENPFGGGVAYIKTIPEPATLGLLGVGLAGAVWRRRRRRPA